jgi:6-pyruvoyltetrahydropterin/6-carboxytetrahydropterin synthase
MIQLSREIRFALLPTGVTYPLNISNSWAGWPTSNLVVPRLKLRAVIEGEPDSVTGYVCNITVLDDLLRQVVTDSLLPKFGDERATGETMVRHTFDEVNKRWPLADRLLRIELYLSPQLSYSINTGTDTMVQMTQQFEFSAAHRLHCDSLTDQENRDTFGKCNNPHGHGHNYVVEVSVAGEIGGSGSVVDLNQFQDVVKAEIVDRLDHKHLNHDVPYFADVNPSVENIAIAIYGWLDGKVGAELRSVKVFETPKTWAEYCGAE